MHRSADHPTYGVVKLAALAAVMMCLACAGKSYIDIDYRLPGAADTLAGRTVFIETLDQRTDTEIFNPAAKEKFQHFTGLFSLSLEEGDDKRTVLGAYPLPQLFETAMARRLRELGVQTATRPDANTPVFQIKINRFHIHLVDNTWQADVSYEANLSKDTQLVAREVVTGTAERMKVIGTGGAEKVIGEIFTDMINRLNIERLFSQAKL